MNLINTSPSRTSLRLIPFSDVTVQPAIEPITVQEVKDNAYVVDDTSQDRFIATQLIPEARRMIENLANRSLITQTRVQYYDDLRYEMFIRYSPLQSITSITYKDSAEASQTLTASLYDVDTVSIPGRVNQGYNETYPDSIVSTNSVVVTAVCGYGDAAIDVPIIYRRAMIMWASLELNNRTGISCAAEYERALAAFHNLLAIEGVTCEYA